MNHIHKSWDKYFREVIPHDAPLIQIVETRRAFYTGAAALFVMMMENTKKMTEEEGIKFIAEVSKEIEQFGKDMIDGRV